MESSGRIWPGPVRQLTVFDVTKNEHQRIAEQYLELLLDVTSVKDVTAPQIKEHFAESKLHGVHIFGAFDWDRLVGIASLHFLHHPQGMEGRVEDVATRSGYRNRGICRALFDHIEEFARSSYPRKGLHGVRKLTLDANPDAAAVYAKLGWSPNERQFKKVL